MPCHLHSLCGAVYYGFYIYLIQFIKGLFLHDGRYVEKLSSPHPVLARVHASAVSRMENLGRTARWTPATITVWWFRCPLQASCWNSYLVGRTVENLLR